MTNLHTPKSGLEDAAVTLERELQGNNLPGASTTHRNPDIISVGAREALHRLVTTMHESDVPMVRIGDHEYGIGFLTQVDKAARGELKD